MMRWYDDGHFGWGGWLLGSAVMVVFWALVIAGTVLLVRYLMTSRGDAKPVAGSSTAQALLAERYARGEIDDEEYRRRLTLLRQSENS